MSPNWNKAGLLWVGQDRMGKIRQVWTGELATFAQFFSNY